VTEFKIKEWAKLSEPANRKFSIKVFTCPENRTL